MRSPEEHRSWDEPEGDPERAIDEMRRSIERAREQVRHYREIVKPESHGDV
jgi:hypothetical protein